MKEFRIKIDNEYIAIVGNDYEIGTEEPYIDGEQLLTIYNGEEVVFVAKWKEVRYMTVRELPSEGIKND